jgi:glycosyltransferase involved in cell wall biosynthesis
LLGSVPHKNLENYAYEDKAPHHPYHDIESLGVLLDSVFKHSHLWPLKGAQHSLGFADSFLSAKQTEILFKCGSIGDDHKWWELMRKKKVLRVWFGPTQHEGDVYYRMRCFADAMRDRGIEAAYDNYEYQSTDAPSTWQNRCKNSIVLNQLDAILKVADVSVWQCVNNPDALAMLRCARDVCKKPIVTDVDDWLFDVPQYNIASGPYKPSSAFEWYALKQLENSDAIVCSTTFIERKLRAIPQLEETPYYIIPNCIDFKVWGKLKEHPVKKQEGVIRIGYSGCGNHGGDLYMIRDVLISLLKEFPTLEFIWAVPMKNPHDPDKDFVIDHPRAKCVNEWYTIAQFPQILKNWDLDIGIAPLLDNNFNRAKSNLRWLEYSALKLPCVASDVEPFRRSVVHQQDGLLCRGSMEWYKNLRELIVSIGQRKRLGDAAYQRVKRDFNLESMTTRYASMLEEIKRKGLSHATLPVGNGNIAAPQR